jgi:outer membrane lipoprotein-sorting protein
VKPAALILAAIAVLGFPRPAHALEAAELMQVLSDVPSSRARFIETRQSALLKKPLVLSGRLVYRRPDRLEKHVLTPFEESITVEGTRVSITRQGAEAGRMFALPASGPAQALIESLRATLAGDLPALERHFAIAVSGTRGDWTMSLTPRDPALGAVVLRVEFAGKGNRIQRIEVLEAGGDRSVTTISDEDR